MGVYVTGNVIYGVEINSDEVDPEIIAKFLEDKGVEVPKVDGYYGPEYEENPINLLAEWVEDNTPLSVEYGGQDDYTYYVFGVSSPKSFFDILWTPTPLRKLTNDLPQISGEQEQAIRDISAALLPDKTPDPEWSLVVSRG